MNDDIDIERTLRDTLAERAARAPEGGLLAERILHEATLRPAAAPRNRSWRTWTLPLVAAGAVAAIAIALVGVNHYRTTASHHVAPATQPNQQQQSVVTSPVAPSPSAHPAPSTATAAQPAVGSAAAVGVSHFEANDLSWVGNDGWAWGTADCLTQPGQACAAMVRTTDDGATWHSMKGPAANVPLLTCEDPCVQNIRFASPSVGYAFGPKTFFMTTDGGTTWAKQAGGAYQLETLDGNVIRVGAACLPGCPFTVQIAQIGSTHWQSVTLPGAQPNMDGGASLVRAGSEAFLDVYGHVSGGAENATSVLFTSGDNGTTWTSRGEPCPQTGGGAAGNEVDSTALTAATDGSLTVLCTPRGGSSSFTVTSTDAGQSFSARGASLPDTGDLVTAASRSADFVSTSQGSYRSTDAGASWQLVTAPRLASARWLGFESGQEGRVVDANGSTIWTTHDAGASWSGFTFG